MWWLIKKSIKEIFIKCEIKMWRDLLYIYMATIYKVEEVLSKIQQLSYANRYFDYSSMINAIWVDVYRIKSF